MTFIPLNRIAPKEETYPKANDAFPMIDKLVYHEKFKKAMMQVFGRTLIARSLEVAAAFSKQYPLDSITLMGDKVNRKGPMTGGYIDASKARIKSFALLREIRAEIRRLTAQLDSEKQEADRKDQSVARFLGEIQKLEESRKDSRNALTQAELDLRSRTSQRLGDQKALERHVWILISSALISASCQLITVLRSAQTKLLETCQSTIRTLEAKLEGAREEMKSELTDTLTSAVWFGSPPFFACVCSDSVYFIM